MVKAIFNGLPAKIDLIKKVEVAMIELLLKDRVILIGPAVARVFSIVLLAVFPAGLVEAQRKPNVLFIVSEDNSEQLGCYGETRVHTPQLDQLAATGVRYTRAYVPYSVCSPSRSVFLTGLYTRQTGHIGLATHKFAMYKDFKTMPAYFKEAGYYTGFLGKTHVNPERLVEDFVDYRALPNANFSKTVSIQEYAKQGRTVMENAIQAQKPFLLIINYPDAHRKFVNTSKNGYPTVKVEAEIQPFPWIGSDSPHLRQELKNYLSCMNRLDEGIGMVLKDLDDLELRKETLIVYISDHGADFPRAKGSIYESGTRIPMIVNFPKEFSTGKVETGMVSTVDILPTMLRTADMKIPGDLPGLPLQDLDQGTRDGRKYIHTFTTGSAPALHYIQFGIRDERYKLIYNPYRRKNLLAASRYVNSKLSKGQHFKPFLFPEEYELYDLQNDPYELTNLANMAEHQSRKFDLFDSMRQFQTSINDPFINKTNLDAFEKEQLSHQKINYRKKANFRWPHLEMFKKTNVKSN
ncbi:MAG: sulfatase [Planctomycetaceae bacterium]|nr:sulfatase [Planctomycetaceae bacterium]